MARKAHNEPRKRPRQARSQQMVDDLIDATARVLVRRGFEASTTNEIARVAGVSIGSLYQYFPGKDALVAALVERKMAADIAHVHAMAAAVQEAPLSERLRVSLRAAVALYRKDLDLYRALLVHVPRVGRVDATRALARKSRETLRAMLESCRGDEVRDLDPDLGAFVLCSAIEWVILAAVLEQPERLDDPRLVDELVTLALGYLKPPR